MTKKLSINAKIYYAMFFGFLMVIIGLALFISPTQAAFAPITKQLDFGSTGTDVTNLQTFLASSPAIYPQRIVSGYFGPLTRNAVTQLQVTYGLAQVGRVGPATLARINNTISSGLGLDVNSPIVANIGAQTSSTTAMISWNTDEQAGSKVFYSTSPILMSEVSSAFTEPSISGNLASSGGLVTSHSVAITGLQRNTTYNYVIETIDASGNVSVTLPLAFKTLQ
jgi:hypothetical protein